MHITVISNVIQVGSVVVSKVSSTGGTWIVLVIMLILHLGLNYAAVRSVEMRSLNRQRANLVFSHILAYEKVLTPKQVARAERIFEKDGALRWVGQELLGYARIGVGLENCVEMHDCLQRLTAVFQDENYLLFVDMRSTTTVKIVLKSGCTSTDQLKSWLQALIVAKSIFDSQNGKASDLMAALTTSLDRTNQVFVEYRARLVSAGWTFSEAALETNCGPRISVDQ
jgi:hypothetical protein